MLRIRKTSAEKRSDATGWTGLLSRLRRSRDGAAALEFAILAVPFFIIIFASIETFVAFTAEQMIASATDSMARKIRTGQITFNQGKSTDMTKGAVPRSLLPGDFRHDLLFGKRSGNREQA